MEHLTSYIKLCLNGEMDMKAEVLGRVSNEEWGVFPVSPQGLRDN
jgi:hypothetical protein